MKIWGLPALYLLVLPLLVLLFVLGGGFNSPFASNVALAQCVVECETHYVGSCFGYICTDSCTGAVLWDQCEGAGGCVGNAGGACNVNSCGQAGGTIQCDGSCSGSTPGTLNGQECFSGTNSCGQFNVGSYDCSGNCSATTPSNSQCGSCVPGNQCLYGGQYYGGGNYCCGNNVCNKLWTCGSNWACNTPGPEQIHGVPCECGCSSGSCIVPPGNYGNSCTSAANSCGQTNGGTIRCDGSCSATTPANPTGYGTSCTSAPNACGQTNGGTVRCDGSCSAAPPANPPGYGASCTSSANSCGQTNGGTIRCDGSCSATTPADPPWLGGFCNSAPNSCGQVNSGFLDCGGSCSASPPSEAGCNVPPSATNLNRITSSYCLAPSPPYIVSWTFSDPDGGDSQSAYQVQVDNNSNFNSPEVDSGQVSSSSVQYAPPGLSYNTTYYWRVRVRDAGGPAWSSYTVGTSFATAPHAYPSPNFTWAPASPSAEESISFTDTTTFAPASTSKTWEWTFADSSSSTEQDPEHVYSSNGSYNLSLEACDNAGCCTNTTKTVNVGIPFPGWEEVSPFGVGEILRAFARVLGFAFSFQP